MGAFRSRTAKIALLVVILALAGGVTFLWWRKKEIKNYPYDAHLVHLACGHSGAERIISRDILAKLSASGEGKTIAGWKLLGKEDGILHLVREDPRACPACRRGRFLGIASGGVIAVYSGTPQNPGALLELTTIRADALPAPELSDLRRGIPFLSKKERLELLEGLTALLHE